MSFQVSRFTGRTVLVVEDDQDSRAMLGQMLEALGARVVLAGSVSAALDALADGAPDLILCDLRLAGLDGFGLIRRVREDPRLSGKPVVAVTARGSAADYQQTWEAGFDGHFVKPIDFDTAAEILGRYLPDRPASADPRAA
jgi:CheY-like chemotaxis protein